MAWVHGLVRLDCRCMIFERVWYEWDASAKVDVAGWCN